MRKVFKKVTSHSIAFVLGAIIFGGLGVYAATTLASSSVQYNNSTSGGSSTTVQGAIDELYNLSDIRKRSNIVSAYTYNASTCVTGEESTCVATTCYKTKTANSCKAGDIIKYKVNDTDIVTFHVMFDNGTTMTMLSQKNVVSNTNWNSISDYATYNTDGTVCAYDACNDEGPMTVLVALERSTKLWTNVNNQTYTLGTTSLSSKGAYTGCSSYSSCTANTYTLAERTAKARLITAQEAYNLGCTTGGKTCPKWMYNYLYNSISYGGTVNDKSSDTETGYNNWGFWTMSAKSSNTYEAWCVDYDGTLYSEDVYNRSRGARAVVVVNK